MIVSDEEGNPNELIGLDWYDGTKGHIDVDAPDLAIAFANGRVQITKGISLGKKARLPIDNIEGKS